MSRLKLSINRKGKEVKKNFTKEEKRIVKRSSLVFSVCKLKSDSRRVIKLGKLKGKEEFCTCVIPYTKAEMLNRKGSSTDKGHLQTIRMDRLEHLSSSEYVNYTVAG